MLNSRVQIIPGMLFITAVIMLIMCAYGTSVFGEVNTTQEKYRYENDDKVRYKEVKAFIICDDCEESSQLTKKKLPKLSIKFSGDKTEEKKESQVLTKLEPEKVIHYQAPEQVPFTVYFGYNEEKMPADEEDRLTGLAQMLIEDGYNEFEAVGYTDKVGPKGFNLNLSSKRADAVKELLSSLGAVPSATEGRGKCCLLSSDEDSRRVEIIFKKGGKQE